MIKAVIFDMYETLITLFDSPVYFCTQMAEDAGIPKEDFQIRWRMTEEDRTTGGMTVDEVIEEILKSKGYKIGLISNCHSEEAMVIKQSILFPYFDAVCLSYDEGIKKPDHRIFEKCMEKLCVDAADCLYVGDGGSRELETAGEIGMHPVQAVWYLKEGTTQPTGRMSEFTNIENPLGVIEIILQTSDKLN